jgi:hypothetical protein
LFDVLIQLQQCTSRTEKARFVSLRSIKGMRDISIEIEKYQKDELKIGHLLYLDSTADPISESPASRSSCPAMDARFSKGL